ncbi:helix-turn-helix transcriptional regulator [Hymenobacter cheonanensis]|uniref:helix-turn-helix transcriptional regulator n=1 Tax=Hymenobacter sp. CA2-7 TaxID=3063993 RepID=UPI002713CCEC|nr:LuxR C-terminal-related transcriptional regulator [Hymenobacter sp. CA2-7]MDO7884586.1 LuxR C-terminal-related transcriptional regulator [Hymenobacter sp. CA2-7]
MSVLLDSQHLAGLPGVPPALLAEVRHEAGLLARRLFASQCLVVFEVWQQQCCYSSPGTTRLLGYEAPELSLELLYQAIHPADLAAVMRGSELASEFLQQCGPGPGPAGEPAPPCFSIDYRLRCRAGHYLHVLRQNFIIAQDAQGHPLATASLFTDITAHKNTEDVRFSLDRPEFAGWLAARKGKREDDELSPREQEILRLILAGKTNAAIAEKLFISYFTVKTHRRNIQRKIKSNNISRRLAHLGVGIV